MMNHLSSDNYVSIKSKFMSLKNASPHTLSLMESPECQQVLANIVCQVNTGRAIIFNHEVYTNKMLPRRHGTEKDMEKLKITLKKYNFQVEVREDQSVRKIRKYLGKRFRKLDCCYVKRKIY